MKPVGSGENARRDEIEDVDEYDVVVEVDFLRNYSYPCVVLKRV